MLPIQSKQSQECLRQELRVTGLQGPSSFRNLKNYHSKNWRLKRQRSHALKRSTPRNEQNSFVYKEPSRDSPKTRLGRIPYRQCVAEAKVGFVRLPGDLRRGRAGVGQRQTPYYSPEKWDSACGYCFDIYYFISPHLRLHLLQSYQYTLTSFIFMLNTLLHIL